MNWICFLTGHKYKTKEVPCEPYIVGCHMGASYKTTALYIENRKCERCGCKLNYDGSTKRTKRRKK